MKNERPNRFIENEIMMIMIDRFYQLYQNKEIEYDDNMYTLIDCIRSKFDEVTTYAIKRFNSTYNCHILKITRYVRNYAVKYASRYIRGDYTRTDILQCIGL